MSASVTRRIRRNMLERETGCRSHKGHNRIRGMAPDARAAREAEIKAALAAKRATQRGR